MDPSPCATAASTRSFRARKRLSLTCKGLRWSMDFVGFAHKPFSPDRHSKGREKSLFSMPVNLPGHARSASFSGLSISMRRYESLHDHLQKRRLLSSHLTSAARYQHCLRRTVHDKYAQEDLLWGMLVYCLCFCPARHSCQCFEVLKLNMNFLSSWGQCIDPSNKTAIFQQLSSSSWWHRLLRSSNL